MKKMPRWKQKNNENRQLTEKGERNLNCQETLKCSFLLTITLKKKSYFCVFEGDTFGNCYEFVEGNLTICKKHLWNLCEFDPILPLLGIYLFKKLNIDEEEKFIRISILCC